MTGEHGARRMRPERELGARAVVDHGQDIRHCSKYTRKLFLKITISCMESGVLGHKRKWGNAEAIARFQMGD